MLRPTSPRRYQVTHRTEYRYGEPIETSHTVARLEPRRLPHQAVRETAIAVDPSPEVRQRYRDAFGNHVTYLAFHRPHEGMVVTATSEVDIDAQRLGQPGGAWDEPWEAAVAATTADGSDDGLLARQCRLESPHVPRHQELRDFAAREFRPGRTLGDAATGLCGQVYEEFEFVAGATDVSTPVLDVLDKRRGVCQDFAHLVLGALRSLGLGARYVSGYLETDPPPGKPRLAGADASHAWVGLYVPGHGWVDLDPTNGLVQPDRHVTVAWGRDYSDVAPVRGVLYGPRAEQHLDISVDVVPLA